VFFFRSEHRGATPLCGGIRRGQGLSSLAWRNQREVSNTSPQKPPIMIIIKILQKTEDWVNIFCCRLKIRYSLSLSLFD